MLFNGVGVFGRLPPAYIADRYTGPLNILIPILLGLAVLSFAWTAVKNEVGMCAFSLISGLLTAGVFALETTALASLEKDTFKIGIRIGMSYTIGSFGALTGPPIGGALIDYLGGNYAAAQTWAAVSLLLAGILMVAARIARTGWTIWEKV